MASSTLTPELLRRSSISPSPLEYFTDSSNTINTKSDLVLIVGEQKYYCHRLLLALISPVFVRMFDGQFKEHVEREITLEGKSSESILELLKYVYPQFHGQITNTNIDDFLQLADEYMIEHLKQPCKDFLIKQLEPFRFVVLPTQKKLEQPSIKSKHVHTSDSALHPMPSNDEQHPSEQEHSDRSASSHRSTHQSRIATPKPNSSHLKPGDKTTAANAPSRYVMLLDKTKFPTFHDVHNKQVPFTTGELELWFRRLRILYRIDKGRNYGEVIDRILSILQFVPATVLVSIVRPDGDTFANDEAILNDVARARMHALEEWATDGDPYRSVTLTESYRTTSISALLMTQQAEAEKAKVTENEANSFQPTLIVMSDDEET